MLVLTHRYLRKYKNITFVNIFLIYSHYDPGNPFFRGRYFFWPPPVRILFPRFSIISPMRATFKHRIGAHRKDTRVGNGTYEVCVPTHVALRIFIGKWTTCLKERFWSSRLNLIPQPCVVLRKTFVQLGKSFWGGATTPFSLYAGSAPIISFSGQ